MGRPRKPYDPYAAADASGAGEISDLSNEKLDVLAKVRPDLRRQIDLAKSIRSRRMQIEAEGHYAQAATDPHKFFWEILGARPTAAALTHGLRRPTTFDQDRVVDSVMRFKRSAIPSGQGTGKTWLEARLVLWYLARYDDAIVITTSSSWTLVEAQIWREIHDAFIKAKVPLPGRLLQTELRISEKHFALGISTDDAAKFQGFHSGHVMVLIDEAVGVKEEIWTAAEAITLGRADRIVAFANPTDPASHFAQVCKSPLWNVVRMDCREHPNVKYNDASILPGAVTLDWINEQRDIAGSEDTPLFQARVCGNFPTSGQNSLISLATVERAQTWDERHRKRTAIDGVVTHQGKGVALGLDIAGPGSDLCVLWAIEDGRATLLWWTIHREIMETAGKVLQTINTFEGRARVLALDDTGIGNGVGSRLVELQRWEQMRLHSPDSGPGYLSACSILRINFGTVAQDQQKYRRVRDELWFELAIALREDILGLPTESELARVALPKGNNLTVQLTSAIYEPGSDGRLRVYDRRDPHSDHEKLRALPTKSPDLAHSLMLARRAYKVLQADWTTPEPHTILEQRAKDWRDRIAKDIKRGLKGPGDPMEGENFYDYC